MSPRLRAKTRKLGGETNFICFYLQPDSFDSNISLSLLTVEQKLRILAQLDLQNEGSAQTCQSSSLFTLASQMNEWDPRIHKTPPPEAASLCHSAPPFFLFFFFSINWFRKIEIPRKKVRQRWKQTIKSWDSARCQASCASCNRQILLKLFDGNSSFTHSRWISPYMEGGCFNEINENITGGRAHQNKMLGWSLDAQGQYIFNNSDYSQSRKTFSPNRKQFLTVRISHIVDWVQDVLL